ncbi:hypothetical protein A7C99_2150 [Trichophyton rubrum]|nr:hypothetical protein A7C99_2150 [Trichophyton rubrum]
MDRGGTVFPEKQKQTSQVRSSLDFDGEVTIDGIVYNKFQVQPYAGRIPSSISSWRERNGGTHAVMGSMYVKKGGDELDVSDAWDKFVDEFKQQGK